MSRRIAIVGGGITGLATAWFLRHGTDAAPDPDSPADMDVALLEGSDRLGGKILSMPFDGQTLDVGADAFLARRPEAERLARRLGLGDDLVAPRSGQVWLWVGGALRPLPSGTVFGVPSDARSLLGSGAVGPGAIARTVADPFGDHPLPDGDLSIAELIAPRLGREVLDVLVEPLLGGVYAGSVDRLSVLATTPILAEAARHPSGLVAGCRAHRRRAAAEDAPVFLTVDGGLGRMIQRLREGLERDDVRMETPVRQLSPVGDRWELAGSDGSIVADEVVLAVPAHVATQLVESCAPEAAGLAGGIDHASVAVITLAYPRAATGDVPDGSGMLVPRTEGRLVKAATWSSGKWPHLHDAEHWLLRCSVGRIDDRSGLALDDDTLADRVEAEVREALSLTGPAVQRRVTRWDDALPQYDVGHLERVAAIRAALPAGLHVAGAAYDGIGIAPCVAAAERLAGLLRR